jgi:hypothetical protein
MTINRNYGLLINGYPQYFRFPIQIARNITINGVVHPAGLWLSTDDEAAILELGYKPIIRTEAPVKEGYYYTEKWTDPGAAIVQEWEEHEQPSEATEADYIQSLEELGVTFDE